MAEIVKLGSMYLDGTPAECGAEVYGQALTIGDTCPGYELTWVKVNGLLVANYAICTNVKWEQLNNLGFIFGKPVWIDGKLYLCRSLKVGSAENVPNEWDAILDATDEDDDLWHWKDIYFWGQETTKVNASTRVIRGCASARYRNNYSASSRRVIVGFRPVLEPLMAGTAISDDLIGQLVKVYGPTGTITGTLLDITDYDLILSFKKGHVNKPESINKWFCHQPKNKIVIIDRDKVEFFQNM